MSDILKPRDGKEVEEAVRWALSNDKALEVAGQGTKRAIGRPSQTDLTLDLSGLTGVTLYEPAELVLSARAGTPLAEIEARAARCTTSSSPSSRSITARCSAARRARGTIGGVIAANLSGPRRIKAGAARDHFLGVTAVTGRGDTIKSGGRVVKNVTGYDLCKLFAGSWGTLGAMTDVTIKVLPKPETEATVLVHGPRRRARLRRPWPPPWARLTTSPAPRICPITSPPGSTACRKPEASTALRLEGHAPSVAHRKETLAALMAPFGPVEILDDGDFARALAQRARRSSPSPAARERPLWRISVAPARGHELAAAITPAAQMFYDWAGGLIWVAMPLSDEPDAAAVRGAVAAIGGHATLIRAPAVGARGARCVRARGAGHRRAQQAREGQLRSQGRAQSRPHVGGGVRLDANQLSPSPSSPIRQQRRRRKKSCAPACIAASAPPPARLTCCSATSSIPRAGAST